MLRFHFRFQVPATRPASVGVSCITQGCNRRPGRRSRHRTRPPPTQAFRRNNLSKFNHIRRCTLSSRSNI